MNRKRNATEGPCWLGLFLLVAGWMLIPSMASAQASNGEQLCEDTGGTWVETSCGDYFCGQPPLCYALIPGCDCGEGMNFGEDGCFKDPEACEGISVCSSDAECEECETCLVGKCLPSSEPECLGLNDKKLCVDTGGQWDPFACGDAKCGIPNPCEAIIPGCNCGPTESFQSGVGCVEDPSCEGVSVECMTDDDCEECGVCGGGTCYYLGLAECASDDDCPPGSICGSCSQCEKVEEGKTKEQICEGTGGTWYPETCGDWQCGEQPLCEAIIPGCDCGKGMNFGEEGCFKDPICGDESNPKAQLCVDTGGTWDSLSCGDWFCGYQPECLAIDPGCNCGEGMNFGEDGCFKDPICGDEPDPEAQLCVDTGGTWDENSCDHWQCGVQPTCEAIIPGCNCGEGMNFTSEGCVEDDACGSGEEASSEEGGEEPAEEGGEEASEEGGEEASDEGGEEASDEGGEEGSEVTPEQEAEAQLCEDTEGTWDENSCEHWQCGVQPTCEAIIPGCNCGEGMNFTAEGCVEDDACDSTSDITPIDGPSAPSVGSSSEDGGCKTSPTGLPGLTWVLALVALGLGIRLREARE